MKRYLRNTIILAGFITLGTLNSCKKSFLDLKPYTSLNASDAITTEKDMLAALNGTYSSLRSAIVNYDGVNTTTSAFGRNIPVIGDLAADNTFLSVANSGRYLTFNAYTWTLGSAEYRDIWANLYTTILKANNIITSTLPQTTLTDQYKGEAYAVRALCYFELVNFFARPYTDNPNSPGVPLVLKFDYTLKPSRNTVGEVYAQILSDLDKTYTLSPAFRGSGYFSKFAARGFAAKVALFKGDNTTALTYAQDVITNGGFALLQRANVLDYWGTTTPQATKGETLFEVVSDNVLNLGNDELASIYQQAGYGDILCTPSLYTSYATTDIRKSLIIAGARVGAENPAFIVNKFKALANDRDDKKVMRMSDVYLVAAEAAQSSNSTLALTYLNALVAQRDPSKVYVSTGAALLEDIITERRKELAFEGDRLLTLNRLKRDVVRSDVYPSAAQTIPYTNYRRIGPIPLTEINNNPNITQNPGY